MRSAATEPATPVATATPTSLPPSASRTAASPAAPAPAATLPAPPGPADPLVPRAPLETAPPVGLPACAAGALTVTDADAVYGTGVVRELFVVRTTGPDCQVPGKHPTVAVLDGAGAPLAPVTAGGLGLPEATGQPVTLSRTTSLSFFVVTKRDGACAPAAALAVTLPGTSTALRAPTGMQVCDRTLAVGPVQRLGDDE